MDSGSRGTKNLAIELHPYVPVIHKGKDNLSVIIFDVECELCNLAWLPLQSLIAGDVQISV